jgi:hypothetical protein
MIAAILAITVVVLVLLDKSLAARGTTDWPVLRQYPKIFTWIKLAFIIAISVVVIAIILAGGTLLVSSMIGAL